MTVYRYAEVQNPPNELYRLYALHIETIEARADQILAEMGAGYPHGAAVADAEGEAAARAMLDAGGPAQWWTEYPRWSVMIHFSDVHPNIVERAGGWDAIQWQDAMPDLP